MADDTADVPSQADPHSQTADDEEDEEDDDIIDSTALDTTTATSRYKRTSKKMKSVLNASNGIQGSQIGRAHV